MQYKYMHVHTQYSVVLQCWTMQQLTMACLEVEYSRAMTASISSTRGPASGNSSSVTSSLTIALKSSTIIKASLNTETSTYM